TLTGETGCGKDLLAKAIHYNSNRKDKRFISVNCAALPEALLESELFGHKRGSFTGADRDKPGLFEEADGGTFFMDEIGDMPLSVQAKLLRVLEEKEIVRLGESVPRKVDVRVISATNKDLSQLIEEKLFRPDLYYRLSPVMFRIPPMRERRDDIPALIKHFKGESEVTFTAEAMRLLIAYDWPGNVREIENEVKKLCLICGENKIVDTDLLTPKISGRSDTSFKGINGAKGTNRTNGSNGVAALEVDEIMQSSGDGFSLYDFLAEHEIRFITRALRDSGGVKKHAAALLKIPESTLRLKIKQYAIDPKSLILSDSPND
ncbi:MAG: sigma-54-dependent Fis family transcriptional regulator, partial [candidate division Zixibacteria bacterium]|nr:sigma-54-dependent Fis family transcriptional regulator [candidate division Zixibacteria bacterium]